MREILFRGKRADNGEWVYGAYQPPVEWGGRKWDVSIACVTEHGWLDDIPVIPETVGQFTGLTDKNGEKIFEGDLLDGFEYPFYRSEDNAHNYFGEIVWFDKAGAFGLVTHKYPTSNVRGISAGNCDYIEEFDLGEWEIIGNIHDNPKLLEG